MILSGTIIHLTLFMTAMSKIREFFLMVPALVLVLLCSYFLVNGEKNILKRMELGMLFFFAGPAGVFGLLMLAPETFIGASALEMCLVVWWGYIAWRMETPPHADIL